MELMKRKPGILQIAINKNKKKKVRGPLGNNILGDGERKSHNKMDWVEKPRNKKTKKFCKDGVKVLDEVDSWSRHL